MDTIQETPRQRLLAHFRRRFITGLILVVPLVVAYLVLRLIFDTLDGVLQPVLENLVGRSLPGAGLAALVITVYLVGLLWMNVVGRRLIVAGQGALLRVPFWRSVYSPAKLLIESFSGSSSTGFKRVVLIEYPRQGTWTIGFLTSLTKDQDGKDFAMVYIPIAPTPQTGWVAILPVEEVWDTDLSVQQALGLVLSGGIATPPLLARKPFTPLP